MAPNLKSSSTCEPMLTLFWLTLRCLITCDHVSNTGPRPQTPTMVSRKDLASNSSNVNLTCLIDYALACPQRLFWNLNNNSEPLPESGEKYKIQVKDTQSKCKKEFILSVFNVTEHDEGTYSCHWRCENRDLNAAIDLKVSDEAETGESFNINIQYKWVFSILFYHQNDSHMFHFFPT